MHQLESPRHDTESEDVLAPLKVMISRHASDVTGIVQIAITLQGDILRRELPFADDQGGDLRSYDSLDATRPPRRGKVIQGEKVRRQLAVYVVALSSVLVVAAKTPAGDATFTPIDVPGAIVTVANDISPDGDIVGRYIESIPGPIPPGSPVPGGHGFLLSGDHFTSIDFPAASFTIAYGIDARGDIVGSDQDPGGKSHGFLRSGGVFSSIDFPGALGTVALGINPRGDIVGSYTDTGGQYPWPKSHGFLLSGGVFSSIDFPGALITTAWKINPAGQIVGRYKSLDGKFHIYLECRQQGECPEAGQLSPGNESFTSIDFPGAFETATGVFGSVGGINSRGDVVGLYCSAPPCLVGAAGHLHSFVLSGGKFTSFDFPGAVTATTATGINARGDILGAYRDPSAKVHGYLLTPSPRRQ